MLLNLDILSRLRLIFIFIKCVWYNENNHICSKYHAQPYWVMSSLCRNVRSHGHYNLKYFHTSHSLGCFLFSLSHDRTKNLKNESRLEKSHLQLWDQVYHLTNGQVTGFVCVYTREHLPPLPLWGFLNLLKIKWKEVYNSFC